jgi:hypothetical protein
MKLEQVLEAKYAGRYNLDDVLAQYKKVEQDQFDPVYFHSAHINVEANHVLARMYVADGVTEDDVRNQVKQWHDENQIPFGEIVVIELDDDWSVYV